MADAVPTDANEGCPGVRSETAGKSEACAGCPNQSACASGEAKKPDATPDLVASRLRSVKHIILVLSGKGGVGKSTLSAQIAHTLAHTGRATGLLDVDICGPSIPRMCGITEQKVHSSASGWSPVWVNENLGVMSVWFMLPDHDDAIIWRGPRKNGLITQFLTDVDWGDLDYLIIDTPPGTSDEHISLVQLLSRTPSLSGAVVVTTPQEVAMSDVRKELNFCKKTGTHVLGVVENMSGFVCPCCHTRTAIFASSGAGPRGMCESFHVPFLGDLPLDPLLLKACEEGRPYVTAQALAAGDAHSGSAHGAAPATSDGAVKDADTHTHTHTQTQTHTRPRTGAHAFLDVVTALVRSIEGKDAVVSLDADDE